MASKYYVQGNRQDDSDDDSNKNSNLDKEKKKKFELEDDDDYHQEKDKMQSQKQKKNAIFKKLSSTTISAVNIRDFDKVWDTLQTFLKQLDKAAKFIEKQGIPHAFLKTLKVVDEQVAKINAEGKKNVNNLKSFNILRQKLKTKIMPQYKQKLEAFVDEPAVDVDEESEEKSQISSSSDEEQVYKNYLKSDDPMVRRRYWLKRGQQQQDEDEKEKKREEKQKKEDEDEKKKQKEKEKKDDKAKKLKNVFKIEQKKKQQVIIASAKEAADKIVKILKQFAKLNSVQKREEQLELLNSILKQSKDYKDHQKLSLLLVDVPIRLQVTRQLSRNETNFPRGSWNKIFVNVLAIFEMLRESQDQDLMEKIATFQENSDKATFGTTEKEVYNQIKSFINSLQRQLLKSFDHLESNQGQYSQRLQDLVKFVQFMYRLSKQMTFKSDLEQEAAQISFKVLENMYFMNNEFIQKVKSTSSDLTFIQLTDQTMLQQYAKPIFKLNRQDLTTKTLLYLVYNHAINRRDKGKDLLTLTNISETISSRDYYTQICFNRVLVQLGISAFQQGNLYETQQILLNICSIGKTRDENKQNIRVMLGQARYTDKEGPKHKLLPYYLHLNIDLIEAVELISSMILQVPFTLSEGGKITSRSFKKLAYQYEKSHFLAQPLNYRDLVYAASNQLKLGKLKQCCDKLQQIDIWNYFGNPEVAFQNLKKNVKETALKCYILANKDCFVCVSLEGLAKKFEMTPQTVKKLICRDINERKIYATITSDGYLKLAQKRKQKESGLRNITNSLFTKLDELSRNNEQIFKHKNEMVPEEQEEVEKQQRVVRKLHDAITQKLKNILSRRAA